MSDLKQRLVDQNLRLARSAFSQAATLSGLAKQSAINGGARLSIAAYVAFFNDVIKPASSVMTMAAAERWLRGRHSENSNETKLTQETEYFFHSDSAAAFFCELEPSLDMIAVEWNQVDSATDSDELLIPLVRERLPYWANIEADQYLQKLDNLNKHIQCANDLNGEY